MRRPLAVVTGGNRGIGYHIARQLIALNFAVIITSRDPSCAARAAAELGCGHGTLELSDLESVKAFAAEVQQEHSSLDVLVNNAGFAFKEADATPFKEQSKPTVAINFHGTVALTEALLPLLRQAGDARVVFVASMKGALSQLSLARQHQFNDPELTLEQLRALVAEFEADVASGEHLVHGWSGSSYAFSKLALIAYTKLLARREGSALKANACCPGWCDTDMSSHKGPRPPAVGARNAVLLATLPPDGPSGALWENEAVTEW